MSTTLVQTRLETTASQGPIQQKVSTPETCNIHIQQNLFGKYNTATWIHDIYKHSPGVRLNQVVLPGTHDSATDLMTRTSAYAKFHKHRMSQELVYLWGKTQHHSIFSQLMDGIRYLDLRIENDSNTGWRTFHGLLCNNLEHVLDDIGRFASDHKREIIIVDFQHLVNFDFDEHVNLAEFCIKHTSLGPRLAGNHLGADGSLTDYWKADKNVIMFYNEGHTHFSHLFWNRESIENPWPNTSKVEVVHNQLLAGIKQRHTEKFHVSQLVLTPDFYRIISGMWSQISCLFSLTIPNITTLLNNDYLRKLNMTARNAGRWTNIVIVDFYEHSSFVERCLDINMENLNSIHIR